MEDPDLIDPVDELRPEDLFDLVHDALFHALIVLLFGRFIRKAQGLGRYDALGADIGGHDDHGVLEVDLVALGVRDMTLVQDLQQDVKDIRMRLLDLIKQYDRIGMAAHLFGQLATLFIAHIAGCGADDLGDRILLHVLGHIDPDQILVGSEHDLRQSLGELGLSDTGGAQEEERADRTVGILQADTAPAYGAGDRIHSVLLSDHPLVKFILQTQKSGALPLCKAGYRHLCPDGDHGGDILGSDRKHFARLSARVPVMEVFQFSDHCVLLFAQRARLVQVSFHKSPGQPGVQVADLFLHGDRLVSAAVSCVQPHSSTGFIDDIDRLVGEIPVIDVADRQIDCHLQCLFLHLDAVVLFVDMDDPLKANRVRVVYDWQGDNAADNESAYSPWLLYAAGSHGSPRGGRHLNGTKVLVGFASDNIERPYVLGNIQEADTFVELKDVSLETPGKRKFQMWDHVGGVQKFLSGTIAPIVSTVSDFCPAVDYFSAGDGGLQYAGGFCITDRLGLYNISGSTDEREVKISSAWGDVKISAFTGISISAPNGDVKINGKNVEISAGNNLTLTSGKNVGYHLAWGKGEDPSVSSVLSDVCCKLIEKIGEKVQLIDLSFLRNTLEVVFRPHEGSLTLKSNRYMKLETGTNECDYPVAAYNKDYRQYIVDEEAKSTILSSVGGSSLIPGSVVPTFSIIRSLIWIIEKLPGIARVWLVSYKRNYDNLVELRKRFDKTIDTLKTYSDDQEDVCNKYDDMKDDFWDTSDEDDWTEEKLGFKENVKVEGQALEIVEEVCRNRNRTSVPINLQGQPEKIASWVVDRRTKCRNLLVKIANDMRKAIRELRPEWSKEDLSKQFSNEVGYFRPFPDDFITNLENALSKDNCGDVAVFKTDTEMKSLINIYMLTKLEEKYMTRFVAVKFLQSLGFKDDMRRKLKKVGGEIEISEPDFSSKSASDSTSIVNDGYWNDYVQSLSGVPAIKKAESSFLSSVADSAMDAVLGAVSVDEILKFKENYSWSEGKKGGVLFGYKGDTYELKGKEIEKVETIEPSFKSISENSEGIDECDKVKLVNFMNKLRSVMENLK